MSITEDWQGELPDRSFTFGRDTNYPGIGGIEGIGLLRPESTDMPRMLDGSAPAGRDRVPARIITIPMVVIGDTDAAVMANYRTLVEAWRPARTADIALDLRIPGSAETTMRAYGRPLDVPLRPRGLKGRIDTVAGFRCSDPLFYGASVASGTQTTSPYVVPAADLGDLGCDTDRVTITINGNGGTPAITNTTQGYALTFTHVLAGGETYEIDLHERTVTKASANAFSHLANGFRWFNLTGGTAQTITFTGCASITITHRPAYWTP